MGMKGFINHLSEGARTMEGKRTESKRRGYPARNGWNPERVNVRSSPTWPRRWVRDLVPGAPFIIVDKSRAM